MSGQSVFAPERTTHSNRIVKPLCYLGPAVEIDGRTRTRTLPTDPDRSGRSSEPADERRPLSSDVYKCALQCRALRPAQTIPVKPIPSSAAVAGSKIIGDIPHFRRVPGDNAGCPQKYSHEPAAQFSLRRAKSNNTCGPTMLSVIDNGH